MSIPLLLEWSSDNFSSLPWRKNRSFYTTLISEFMLQQTTVATVLKKFPPFLERFPDFLSLDKASLNEVLIYWSGLGYYARAKRLKNLASFFKKTLPSTYEELVQFSGIGPYTAEAILALYYQQPLFALDTNLKRVLQRLQLIKYPLEYSPRNLNEALMDLGRIYCKAKNPKCSECIMQKSCPSAFQVESKIVKKEKISLTLLRFYFFNEEKKLFVYKRKEKTWLENQYEVPTFALEKNSQYPLYEKSLDFTSYPKFKTVITKYSITNILIQEKIDHGGEYLDYKKIPLSTATQKGLSFFLNISS